MKIGPVKYLAALILTACDAGGLSSATEVSESGMPEREFELIATLKERKLNEISGLQSGTESDFFVHNDEGKAWLYVINSDGQFVTRIRIRDAKNRDWEDIARIRREEGNLLVMGDIGDNKASHKNIRLYFLVEPEPDESGRYPADVKLEHKLKLRFPDGPRDCEAMAYDPSGRQLLFLTKRDQPPRLYGLPIDTALSREETELEFLAEVPNFRPPTREDILLGGKRGFWVSQPTGMDISEDGEQIAVITYRSLYLWSRENEESVSEAFQKTPEEYVGPPGLHDEAISFGPRKGEIYVTTEGVPTPLFRLNMP